MLIAALAVIVILAAALTVTLRRLQAQHRALEAWLPPITPVKLPRAADRFHDLLRTELERAFQERRELLDRLDRAMGLRDHSMMPDPADLVLPSDGEDELGHDPTAPDLSLSQLDTLARLADVYGDDMPDPEPQAEYSIADRLDRTIG